MKKFTFDAFIKANAQGLDEIRHAAWTLHENVEQTYDTNLPYGHHLSMVAPDFVNASPKLRFAVR